MADKPKPNPQVFRSNRWNQDHKKKKSSSGRNLSDLDRKKVLCSLGQNCCAYQFIHGDYADSLQQKYESGLTQLREENLTENTHIVSPQASPKKLGYRCHAKLAVRPSAAAINNDEVSGRFAIGMFQPKSHKVVDISYCPLHKSSINRLIKDLKECLDRSSIEPYDENEHTGDLRYLAVRASHHTDQLMLTFVCLNENSKQPLKNLVLELRSKDHLISSAHININPERTNTIFGSLSKRLVGADRLREQLCDLSFEIGPSSFFQVNPWQAENVYRRVAALAGQDSRHSVAWDLYCGTGQISMLLAANGFRVIGIEENPQATRDAQKNVLRNQLDNPPTFMAGRVEAVYDALPSWADEPKVIVVNPSRGGLSEEILTFLNERLTSTGAQLIYVSCEIKTLTRDLKALTAGSRQLVHLESFDMFPYTEKMEWLAVLK